MSELSTTKRGIVVDCLTCGLRKKPIGRSAPLGMLNGLCDHECHGYSNAPHAGSLWPGESEADFGYPVSSVGTSEEEK